MLLLRNAKPEDAEELLPLVSEFVASFELDSEKFYSSFQQLVQDNNAVVVVAQFNGKIVGYCLGFVHQTLYANGPVAWLEEIMVSSQQRRSGIGEKLTAAFEDWAKEQGAVLSALATRRASTFYEAIGYEASATYFRRLL